MGTPMHFRKRQLLEYQIETGSSNQNELQQTPINEPSYSYINEPEIIIEYPLSPSSMESEQSTPTKYNNTFPHNLTNTNEYSTEQMQILAKNTATLLDMENLSPKSAKDAQKLKQIAESLTALENCSNVNLADNARNLTYDPQTLIHFAYILKQTIEDYIKKEISDASANKSSLSSLILAKLNQLRVNALLQPKQYMEHLPYDRAFFPPAQEMELEPEDLSMTRNKYQPKLEVESSEEDMDFEEPKLVIDESYVETTSDNDDIYGNSEDTKSKSKNQKTRPSLQQIVNRISGIFTFRNRKQMRMEELMKNGINVYTLPLVSKSTKRCSSSLFTTQQSENIPYNFNPFKTNVLNQIRNELPINNIPKPLTVQKRKPWTNGLGDEFKYNNNYPIQSPFDNDKLIIGPNGTTITKAEWAKIDWTQTPPAITRKILVLLFDRALLATHSLTGRPSPAFLELNYPEKKPLDAKIVSDLVDLVTSRTIATAKEIRMAITTKCADESKMRRCRETKLLKQNEDLRMRPY